MKKNFLMLFIIFGIMCLLPSASVIKANTINKNALINDSDIENNISIVKIYNSFDDVKEAGEKIFYKNKNYSGYLYLQSAHRIEDSEKFTVVYINNSENK